MRTHALSAIAATMLLAATPAAAGAGNAHAARSLTVKDEGSLHLIKSSGSALIDEGKAHGTLPGSVKIRFTYNGDPTVTAAITIYPGGGGAIDASGSGQLSSPNSPTPSFKGTLRISGGSGRYSHAHGSGTMYGIFYRRSYAITVQTHGTLQY